MKTIFGIVWFGFLFFYWFPGILRIGGKASPGIGTFEQIHNMQATLVGFLQLCFYVVIAYCVIKGLYHVVKALVEDDSSSSSSTYVEEPSKSTEEELDEIYKKRDELRKKLSSARHYDRRNFARPSSYNSHYGGIVQAGKDGEEKVRRILQQLSFPNTVINDKFVNNINSVKDAQIDHFVVSEKGIVMIETKNYAGEIDMRDEKQWIQTTPNGDRRACSNAYYQSVTHLNIMRNLMKKQGFGDVRLYAIVVFANDRTIYRGMDKYHGYVMKYDAMNYYLTGLPACKAMKNRHRQEEVVRWIRSFKDANSYDKEKRFT